TYPVNPKIPANPGSDKIQRGLFGTSTLVLLYAGQLFLRAQEATVNAARRLKRKRDFFMFLVKEFGAGDSTPNDF
ncbi:MAG: hypothetical protein LH606_20265, partial [Cytophagaceae bacterium]|nr:hypothetical protein [Cytophagaceae bacterium]